MSVRSIKAVKACIAAREIGDWELVLRLTDSENDLHEESRLISERIIAADQLGLSAARDQAIALCFGKPLSASKGAQIVRTLISIGQYESAWRLIIIQEGQSPNRLFDLLKSRILAKIEGTSPGGEVEAALKLRASSTADHFRRSDLKFEPEEFEVPQRGLVKFNCSPGIEPRLVEEMENLLGALKASDEAGDPSPFLGEIDDVFLDVHGQIWRENGAMIRDKGKPVPALKRGDVLSLACAAPLLKPTNGLYHWLIQLAPRLEVLLNLPIEPSILVSRHRPDFEIQTTRLAEASSLNFVPIDDVVFVSRLIFPITEFKGAIFAPSLMSFFHRIRRNSLAADMLSKAIPTKLLYISRRDSARRPLKNEPELEVELARRGFETVLLSELPFWKQVATVAQAEVILSPHGAGLSHLAAAAPGKKVIEILPLKRGSAPQRFNYARLAYSFGHRYEAWLEPQLGEEWSCNSTAFLAFLDDTLESLRLAEDR